MNQDQCAENPDAQGPHFKLELRVVYPDGEVDSCYHQGGQLGVVMQLAQSLEKMRDWTMPVLPVPAMCPVCYISRPLHTVVQTKPDGYFNQGCFGCGDEPWFEAFTDVGLRAATALAIVDELRSVVREAFLRRVRSDWNVLRRHWACGSGSGVCDSSDPNDFRDRHCWDLIEVARRNGVDLLKAWGIK